MAAVELVCDADARGRVRIYADAADFDPSLNCSLPAAFRQRGRRYIVPREGITLAYTPAGAAYYRVRAALVRDAAPAVDEPEAVFSPVSVGYAQVFRLIFGQSPDSHEVLREFRYYMEAPEDAELEEPLPPPAVLNPEGLLPHVKIYSSPDNSCVYCLNDGVATLVAYPCGHLCICCECMPALAAARKAALVNACRCAQCRTVITHIVLPEDIAPAV